MTIYKEIILHHSKNPSNYGKLKSAHKKVTVRNSLCGDDITLMIIIKKGLVEQVKFVGHGCAISIASASILTEYIKGKSIKDLRKLNNSVILKLLQIDLSPSRLRCALLPLEALHKAIK